MLRRFPGNPSITEERRLALEEAQTEAEMRWTGGWRSDSAVI